MFAHLGGQQPGNYMEKLVKKLGKSFKSHRRVGVNEQFFKIVLIIQLGLFYCLYNSFIPQFGHCHAFIDHNIYPKFKSL